MQRFDSVVDECTQLGENFDSGKVLSRFMDGLYAKSKVYEARIESLLAHKNMSQQNTSIKPVTLAYVQSQLLSIDEKQGLTTHSINFNRFKPERPYAMKAHANFKKPPRTEITDRKRKIQCGYPPCLKDGHTTSECRKRKRDETQTPRTIIDKTLPNRIIEGTKKVANATIVTLSATMHMNVPRNPPHSNKHIEQLSINESHVNPPSFHLSRNHLTR